MKSFTPSELETAALHGLLLSVVAPRPIAFVSTVDVDGKPNLAPFSFFNVFSAAPPIAIFSPARRVRDNTTKHTFNNIETTKECVINMVSYGMLHQMNLASCEYEQGVNEFEKAGLTALPSEQVRPFRVKESPAQLECKVREVIRLGSEGGAGNLVVCEIVRMHVSRNIFGTDGKPDPKKLDLMARMGQNWYCRANGDAVFEVPKPGRSVGIGVDAIPEQIRNSSILSGNDLGKLGMIPSLPSQEEVVEYGRSAEMMELRSSAGSALDIQQKSHDRAKALLLTGRTMEAWKMLLACELS